MIQNDSELRKHLQKYLDGNSNRSIPRIAQQTGVGDTTIRRIVTGECVASLETALNILKHTATREEMRYVLECDYPENAKAIEHVYGKNETYSMVPPNVKTYLSSHAGCFIINMAAMKDGVRKDVIISVLGTQGEQVLEEMLSTGVLYEEDNKIRYCEKDFSCTDLQLLATQAKHFADYMTANPRNCVCSVQSESLNEIGLKKVQDIIVKCIEDIGDIRQDPSNTGNKPFLFSAFTGLFHSDKSVSK